MTTERIATAAVVAVMLAGCAKSQQPLPNKNTNWLDRCEVDVDCGEALECRCGVCTLSCHSDSECDAEGGGALCWHERSEELDARCERPASAEAICVSPELVRIEDEPDDDECSAPGSCATIIADGLQRPTALALDDQRVYWLESGRFDDFSDGLRNRNGAGALKSARRGGGDIIAHATELDVGDEIKLSSTHAYFTRTTSVSVLSRVPLAGGEVEDVYALTTGPFGGIAPIDSRVYFIGQAGLEYGIYSVPNDGSIYTNPRHVPFGAQPVIEGIRGYYPGGLFTADDAFYWNDRAAVHRLDMGGDGEGLRLASNEGDSTEFLGPIVRAGDRLFWPWRDTDLRLRGLATVDVAGTEGVRRFDTPALDRALAADSTHVYWVELPNSSHITVMRMAHESYAIEPFAVLEYAEEALIALSDEHVFVATAATGELDDGRVTRFSKGIP